MDDLAVPAAVGRIELAGTAGEHVKVSPGLLKLGDPLRDLIEPLVDQLPHVLTGRLPAIPDAEDLTDLPECEPSGLRVPDEDHPSDGVRSIVPIARRSPGRLREKSLAFIEAQRLRGRPRATGQLTDKHSPSLR